jgi:hypothetical protein
MKARLYRATGEARDYIDGYSLYLPYPKWYREQLNPKNYASGCFLGCSPASDGTMIRCCWEELEYRIYGRADNLGRKVKIESMPEPFQKEVRRIEKLWNDALKYNDDEHWNIWNTQA